MNETKIPENELAGLSREQINAALFVQLVIQQANMAMMLLGNMPHPETGKTVRDVEAAKLFIDQLEMLETKTKGNLTRDEEALLKQSLMTLHMAFVEAVQAPATSEQRAETPQPETQEKSEPAEAPPAQESSKRFTKKY